MTLFEQVVELTKVVDTQDRPLSIAEDGPEVVEIVWQNSALSNVKVVARAIETLLASNKLFLAFKAIWLDNDSKDWQLRIRIRE